jgi:hypothetical protein
MKANLPFRLQIAIRAIEGESVDFTSENAGDLRLLCDKLTATDLSRRVDEWEMSHSLIGTTAHREIAVLRAATLTSERATCVIQRRISEMRQLQQRIGTRILNHERHAIGLLSVVVALLIVFSLQTGHRPVASPRPTRRIIHTVDKSIASYGANERRTRSNEGLVQVLCKWCPGTVHERGLVEIPVSGKKGVQQIVPTFGRDCVMSPLVRVHGYALISRLLRSDRAPVGLLVVPKKRLVSKVECSLGSMNGKDSVALDRREDWGESTDIDTLWTFREEEVRMVRCVTIRDGRSWRRRLTGRTGRKSTTRSPVKSSSELREVEHLQWQREESPGSFGW